MHPRLFTRVAITVAVGGLTLGCTSAHHPSAAPLSATPSTAEPAASCPPGLTVAFYGALTGPDGPAGVNQANSVQLAITQFDAAHPHCHLTYQPFDSRGDPATAATLARSVADNQSILAVVGPTVAAEAQQADAIFNTAGLPDIAVSVTTPSLAAQDWTTFHRAIANDNQQGPAIAAFVLGTLKAKNIAVIQDGTPYAATLAGIVRQQLQAAGAATQSFTDMAGQADTSTIAAVKTADPQAIVYAGDATPAGTILRQLRDAGVTATYLTDDHALDPSFIQAATPADADGAYLTGLAAAALTQPQDQPFDHAYQAAFHTTPAIYAAEAYDATNQLLAGILAGNHTRSTLNAYLATNTYTGIIKTYAYNTNGELRGNPPIIIHTIHDGQITLVGPLNVP